MNKVCFECFENKFKDSSYIYHITIKPDPRLVDKIAEVSSYLDKRCHNFMIVSCKSTSGYLHYHGVIAFKQSQSLNNKDIKAVQRQINRVIGFLKIDPLYSSLSTAWKYIHASNNNDNGKYNQYYYYDTIPDHCII